MLSKISHFILPIFLFLIPLSFWTLTSDFFNPLKSILLLLLVLLMFVCYGLEMIRSHTLILPRGIVVLPLIGLIVAVGLNLVLISEGRPESLAGKGTMFLALSLLSLLILTLKNRTRLTTAITASILGISVILSLHSLLQLTWLHTASFLPTYMQTRGFTPTGSFLTTLILILTGGITAIFSLSHLSPRLRPLYLGIATLTTVAAVAIISLMLPGSPLALSLLSYRETWSITLDALKPARSLLLGVGIPNFPLLFTAVKPLSVNLTPLWNTLPQTGTSELLTILATTGLAGFLALLSLIISSFKLIGRDHHPLIPAFIFLVITLIFTPVTLSTYLLLFIILALLDNDRDLVFPLSPRSSLIVGILIPLSALTLVVYSLRPHLADYYLRRIQIALSNNNGKDVYDAGIQAIKWYPKSTLSHLSFAQTNLNLASALSQKTDLTEDDRNMVSTLVQQAISEGKTAIQLRPNYSQAWVILAQIYRNLINVAQGSDQFAIDYYARAVALDAGNPALRIEYGGLFYQLALASEKDSDQLAYYNRAINEFQTAIQLRPTYANAYYNLSKVLETVKDYQNSYLAMQKVVANLDPTGPEYETALSELETLKTKLPKPTPPSPTTTESEGGSLTTPPPLPSPLPGGPIDLPAPN